MFNHTLNSVEMRGISRASLLIVIVVAAVVIIGVVQCAGHRPVETGSAPPAGGVATDRPRPAPAATGFEGCPPEGDGGDPALNRLKNRTDSARFVPTSSAAVLALGWPSGIGRRARANWSPAEQRVVGHDEGRPVAIEGYLAGAKQEGPESPNCHGADARFRDWHLWLSDAPGPDRRRAIVVETTPVIRARQPGWSLAALRRLARDGGRVRVSGWLLLDEEHPEQVERTRGTLWEIHPIMAIEVQRGGAWVPFDALR